MAHSPEQAGVVMHADETLLARLRRSHPGLNLSLTPLFAKPSASITLHDVQGLADAIAAAFANGDTGAVVSHGTDTIEETAFALSLLLQSDRPVILTGAMRPADATGADGPANLDAAILAAASPDAQGLGPAVLFGDELHAAHLVQKSHSTRPHAFSSAPYGPLGLIVEGRLDIAMTAPRRHARFRIGARIPAVPILLAGLDLEPETIAAFADAEVGALVIAGAGGGHVSARSVAAIAALAQKLPIILTSRTAMGHTLTRSYGYAGGEIDLARQGVINGGRWRPVQARIATQILLSNGCSASELAEWLAR